LGLTNSSTGQALLKSTNLVLPETSDFVIALAGNPNTGKSTVFNSLTGLKQHTGNWPGKTVALSAGEYFFADHSFSLIDLPGTYSLFADSQEEEIARDFLCFYQPDVTVVVVDATCLERNLHLALQILEITPSVVVCVNLLDEALRKGIYIDLDRLAKNLGIRVVGTNARDGEGLDKLKEAILLTASEPAISPIQIRYPDSLEELILKGIASLPNTAFNERQKRWLALRLLDSDYSLANKLQEYLSMANLIVDPKSLNELQHPSLAGEFRESIVLTLYTTAEKITRDVLKLNSKPRRGDHHFDRIITSKIFGIPLMLLFLGIVFWLTLVGANYPSQLLAKGFLWIEGQLLNFLTYLKSPEWIKGLFVFGIYRTLSWVIAVMLPPMAIFFPLFTLLEDWGYLPRIAFNLDNSFRLAGAHGKQSLTMCMGFGCNAAGVVACRIIDSPRERLIAILTNNFVPCNGRFPTLITMALLFFSGPGFLGSFGASLFLVLMIVGAVLVSLLVSKFLSKTFLQGLPSSFALELPPFRKPQIGLILIRSLIDRTLYVLLRAILVAAPAGALIWIMSNLGIGGKTFLELLSSFLHPLGYLMGLDGVILAAFLLGFPANEIVLPIILMAYTSQGSLLELENLTTTKTLLINNSWTNLTAFCFLLFSLNHFPCGTTLLTIKKETSSWQWTILSFLLPTIVGILSCLFIAQGIRLLTLFI